MIRYTVVIHDDKTGHNYKISLLTKGKTITTVNAGVSVHPYDENYIDEVSIAYYQGEEVDI